MSAFKSPPKTEIGERWRNRERERKEQKSERENDDEREIGEKLEKHILFPHVSLSNTIHTQLSLSPLTKTHFKVSFSQHTIQFEPSKRKRKQKPSFADQIRDKWSIKNPTFTTKTLPWHNPQQKNQIQIDPVEKIEEFEDKNNGSLELGVSKGKSGSFVYPNRVHLPPWVHGKVDKETYLSEFSLDNEDNEKEGNGSLELDVTKSFRRKSDSFVSSNLPRRINSNIPKEMQFSGISLENVDNFDVESTRVVENDEVSIGLAKSWVKREDMSDKVRGPWERVKKGKTLVAERLIPETELKRLRNVAKRMVERIKVGAAGVNQELVDSIRTKWKEDEVVKMKFEGAPALDMRRTHEVLENRTSGIVIWRSGSSIVLYRGMTYNLPCVQSYTNDTLMTNAHSFSTTTESSCSSCTGYKNDLSNEEITDLSELDNLLQELGPRFRDWSGPEPIPVDADLLPSVVPGGKRPYRLLPNGLRQGLRDKETTFYRQSARRMPPHFALGRNRELQGLAAAMIKLWERSAIAKIAIKRGVQNTNNERMAEELKNLTGGTLLSRNKEFIVFYRGNDFLPPVVSQTLDEARKEAVLKADEEEKARNQLSTTTFSTKKSAKIIPKVAGTLAETIAATSRFGNQPSSEDRERMRRELALARHSSMVKFLENKIALANGKIKKAEKALAKVQESLSPADLPTDLETITDEERFLFRKIGLSMKPYLPLGRRGMFDGTIENIHLHWKYREVVKLIVERKSFAQVKQIAIGLEAESDGVLVCVDKTMKGYVIILYRGKNYQRPSLVRPKNLLTKRQAWAKSIELQRREALKHHISDVTEKIEKLKVELENMPSVEEIDDETFYLRMDDASSDEESEEDGEETFLNDSGDEIDII